MSWDGALTDLGLSLETKPGSNFFVNGAMIPTGYKKRIIRVLDDEDAALFERVRHRLSIKICYCSVYEECWQYEYLGNLLKVGCDAAPTVKFMY